MSLRLRKFKEKYITYPGRNKPFKNIQDELLFPKNIKEILIDIYILDIESYNSLDFSITCTYNPNYIIANFPKEINTIINKYTKCELLLKFRLLFHDTYPYKPATWSLIGIENNFNNNINLENYYNELVEGHNSHLNNSWSAAIYIEKDILLFLTKINHFEYIFGIDS